MADLAAPTATIHEDWNPAAVLCSSLLGGGAALQGAFPDGCFIGEVRLSGAEAGEDMLDEPRWSRRRSLALVVGVSLALWGLIAGSVLLL